MLVLTASLAITRLNEIMERIVHVGDVIRFVPAAQIIYDYTRRLQRREDRRGDARHFIVELEETRVHVHERHLSTIYRLNIIQSVLNTILQFLNKYRQVTILLSVCHLGPIECLEYGDDRFRDLCVGRSRTCECRKFVLSRCLVMCAKLKNFQ